MARVVIGRKNLRALDSLLEFVLDWESVSVELLHLLTQQIINIVQDMG